MKRTFFIEQPTSGTYSATETSDAGDKATTSPRIFESWNRLLECFSKLGATNEELDRAELDQTGSAILTVERAENVERRIEQLRERWQDLIENERKAELSPDEQVLVQGPRYDSTIAGTVMSRSEIQAEVSRIKAELDCLEGWGGWATDSAA
ncbi:MAG TPA: hypothetical protein VFL42_06015 [Terriglobales bacterium]|jgi:hypothetical protein|nr:hypothetical protein [Terriglobales bacterium]